MVVRDPVLPMAGRAKPASATRPVATPAAAGQMPPGNLLRQQIAQEVEQPVLCGPAEQGADKAGQQAKHAQLQGIEQQRVMAGKAQTAEQRTGIEAACGEAGSRQRDGNARQQNRSQARKVQIAFRTAQCAPICRLLSPAVSIR